MNRRWLYGRKDRDVTIKLGDEVRDTITGFSGVVIGITEWLHGCRRMTVQPRALHEGKVAETYSFDEPQLVLVEQEVAATTSGTGGPTPAPQAKPTPSRR